MENINSPVSPKLEDNISTIQARLGNSPDLVIRTYELINRTAHVAAVYIAGITDRVMVDDYISHVMSFQALNDRARLAVTPEEVYSYIKENALSIGKEKLVTDINGLLEALLSGDTVILVNGVGEALVEVPAAGNPARLRRQAPRSLSAAPKKASRRPSARILPWSAKSSRTRTSGLKR